MRRCPSCKQLKPDDELISIGFRKIRCTLCIANQQEAMVLVRQRLKQEKEKGLV